MKRQDILISLDEATYNENTKTFSVDLSQYDLDDARSVDILENTENFPLVSESFQTQM